MKKFLVVLTLLTLLSLASTKLIGDIDSDEASVLNLFELWDKRQIETNKAATEDRESRIVGGQFATPSQFPYQCALLTHHAGVTVHCGGSVISTSVVLTTASCLVAGTTTLIIAGAFDLSRFETQQQRRTVSSSSYRIHAQFNSQTHQNDIATIILPTDLVFNQFVGAISLASGADQFIGRTAVISGFGTLIEPGPLSNHIQFTTRAIVTNPVCYSLFGIIGSSYICTAADFNRASCYGDAGGPLTVLEGGSTLQIGIMSIGCDVGRPGGYTRVSYYINWIHLHMV